MRLYIRLSELIREKEEREGRSIPLAEISEALSVSYPTVQRWTQGGIKQLTVTQLAALLEYFDCTPNDLIVRVDESRETATDQQVADLLGVHVNTIKRLIAKDDLPAFKVGKVLRVNKADLKKYMGLGDSDPDPEPPL